MTIIVTGAGGFVGRQVVARLLESGRKVVAMDSNLSAFEEQDGLVLVAGDLCDPHTLDKAFDRDIEGLVHLASVPGGAAEQDPGLSRRVNIDASLDLLDKAKAGGGKPRVVFASTIAVYGAPLPAQGVDDSTPLLPKLVYGAHKAMIETAVGTMSRRGEVEGMSLRLPGIVARPKGPSGLKSAFMSNLFHAFLAGEDFICPVSAQATMWMMSVSQCAQNIVHGLEVDPGLLPASRAMTLPALNITMEELVESVARATAQSTSLVSYKPDGALEAAFGTHPPLTTAAADRGGFCHDKEVDAMVERAIGVIKAS
ncbi:NAD-dependent epimerase/dehydratase family protein [Emcibacter nanhaiensis]|uniref:NAD-dependent epimerase/dehydratase family protein n=1 Tax=Emcibacter nanhaiensis TaxID=1505037 RepID=A0A501PGB2_9PROT|nr:NAD-dependent epimerase/dehydratase family protein [Emcibacter nanhaiensis]TPD59042.1 NAD-dependent epimerase/dehydratase family protein [Emcibacter nanhaiensis]